MELKLIKNIEKIAKEVIINEADAVRNLTNFINADFEACIKEILELNGRVVVTGVGKSAAVATKIVATLNSTGTPALFMHAADAIHGDLGMIQNGDIVICISKSGNTPEIKVLAPLIKRSGSKLIALVCNSDSYLAKHADYVLHTPIEEEACPNNLAPTTSTTVHMAMGDAIAVSLLKQRGFSSSDFALLHPGGSLGKQLYLKVDDIYPNNELPLIGPDQPVKDAIIEISSKRLGAVAVVNSDNELLGIITDGDVRRMLTNNTDIGVLKTKDIMGSSPIVINVGDYAAKALNIMQQNSITQVIVLNSNKVVGFVHLHDLLKEGIV